MNIKARIQQILTSTVSDAQKNCLMDQLRLDHYNEWLMKDDREFGVPYVSPFTDVNLVVKATSFKTPLTKEIKMEKIVNTPAAVVKRAKAPKANSKLSQVVSFIQQPGFTGKAKAEKLEAIIGLLGGISKANANVYLAKAEKALAK